MILKLSILFGSIFILASILYLTISWNKPDLIVPVGTSITKNDKILGIFNSTSESNIRDVNILLMGFDARHGDKNPRCDAVHMLSLKKEGRLIITTVPRGTVIPIPDVEGESAYLGNTCHIMGVDYTIGKIEKITGYHPDYVVKVGFSELLGGARLLGLPSTPTLQYLRNRRYGIGDYQRSYNQALFLKDMILKHLEEFAGLPKPLQYLAFKMTDTNMSFEEGESILNQIITSGINKKPEKIQLVTKPQDFARRNEYHLEDKLKEESNWKNDPEYKTYQADITIYLNNLAAKGEALYSQKRFLQAKRAIETPYAQQLWEQIEDKKTRFQIHFQLLKIYVSPLDDKKHAEDLITDFISETEQFGEVELMKQSQDLLLQVKKGE